MGNVAGTRILRQPRRPLSGAIPWPNAQGPPAPADSATALTSAWACLTGQQIAPTVDARARGANASAGVD
eukprot:5404976-Pyramimonas_sp.AAC.1